MVFSRLISFVLLALASIPAAGQQLRPPAVPAQVTGDPPRSVKDLDARLRALEPRVHDVRDRLFQSQARIMNLQELTGGDNPGAPAGAPEPGATPRPAIPETGTASRRARAAARAQQGLERLRAGDFAEAALLLDGAVSPEGGEGVADDPAAQLGLADALYSQGLWGSAARHYRRVLEHPRDARARDALVRAIDCDLRLARHTEIPVLVASAREVWGDALPPEALYLAARSAYLREDLPAAQRDREALAALALVPAPFQIAAAYLRGAVYVRAGDLDAAVPELAACDRFVARSSRQQEQREVCWLALGRLHAEKTSWSEAASWYRLLSRPSPRFEEAQRELAAMYEKAGLPEAGLRALAGVGSPIPDLAAPEFELTRGKLLARSGADREAVEAYRQVLSRYEPLQLGLVRALDRDRDPVRYLERLRTPDGRVAAGDELPSVVAGWAAQSEGVRRAIELLEHLDGAARTLADVRASADRVEGILARDASLALRSRVADEQRGLAGIARELELARAEAQDLAAARAHAEFQSARIRLERVLLAADRGIADVALARTADAQRRIEQLMFRRTIESRLPMTDERRRAVSQALQGRERSLAAEERRSRSDAIEQLEGYVARHPDDPVYTPRALSRLAQLQYQHATDDGAQELTTGRDVPRPPRDQRESDPSGCGPTLAMYQRLEKGFPGYREQDSVLLLVGYCLATAGRAGEARDVYAGLIRKFPGSSHVAEAWVRIGDLSFDDGRPESLERAAVAYAKLQANPGHPLYAHALHMLGWTKYRQGQLEPAVAAFTTVLDRLSNARSSAVGPELQGEVLRLTAAAFADPRWDGIARARAWVAKAGGRPHGPLLLRALGDALLEQTRYPEAVQVYKLFIEKAPLSPEAPRVQAKIVLAWSRERRSAEEVKERDVLLSTYSQGTAWWQSNQGSPDLLEEVRALGKASVATAAALHHARARELRAAGRTSDSIAEYRRASDAYQRQVEAGPDGREASDLTYAWADAAYQSEDYERAARLYEKIRDDAASPHREEAALSAVLAWSGHVTQLQKAGRLEDRKLVLARDRAGGPPLPESLPAPCASLVGASDVLVARHPGHERAPVVAYQAGELFYKYGQWEEARKRLLDVVSRWPPTEAAQYAGNLVVETHLAARDWAAVEAVSAQLERQVASANPALATSLRELELGGRFQRAITLMEQRHWAEAAQLFTAVAADGPGGPMADKALYNAARCLESEGRGEVAAALYDRVASEHPSSPLAAEALFRSALRAESRYDPQGAADRYLRLVGGYPGASQRRSALFNGARALEQLQRYADAARGFERYAGLDPTADDAPRAQLHAAALRARSKDWRGAAETLRGLQRLFARGGDHEVVVRSYLDLGLAEQELGRAAAARTAFGEAAAEFARRRLDPGSSPGAAAVAAEARFRLAEGDLERFEAIALPATSSPARLERALRAKLAQLKAVAAGYEEVKGYRRAEWTLAAFYRQGYLLERLAQALYDAPVPPELARPGQEEALAAYQDQLAAAAQPYREQAVKAYAEASEAARTRRVRNEWTARIDEALARWRPNDYPTARRLRGEPLDRELASLASPAVGGLEAAEASARRVLASDERSVDARVRLATVLQARRRLELARAVLEDTTRAEPSAAPAWKRLGLFELSAGRPDHALQALARAIELAPADPEAQADRGALLAEAGDHAAAVEALEVATRLDGSSAPTWLLLGNAYRSKGSIEEARASYERALAIDPGLADAHFNLGVLLLEDGRTGTAPEQRGEAALAHFDRFAAGGGRDPLLARHRQDAERLRDRERQKAVRAASGRTP